MRSSRALPDTRRIEAINGQRQEPHAYYLLAKAARSAAPVLRLRHCAVEVYCSRNFLNVSMNLAGSSMNSEWPLSSNITNCAWGMYSLY